LETPSNSDRFLNLVVNAAEAIAIATDGPREILIDTSQPVAGRIAVAIRDSGVGVKESELERIFETFVSTKPQGLSVDRGGAWRPHLGHQERRPRPHASRRAAVRSIVYTRTETPRLRKHPPGWQKLVIENQRALRCSGSAR
jgi:hypothetical protein